MDGRPGYLLIEESGKEGMARLNSLLAGEGSEGLGGDAGALSPWLCR